MSRRAPKMLLFSCILAAGLASAKVYFEERFTDASFEKRWKYPTKSPKAAELGKFALSTGKFHADKDVSQGLQTSEDTKFYALTAKLDAPFSNKDKPLVFQFSVKHEQLIDCGGGYLKLLPADSDVDTFNGDSKYYIMFGPDICGNSRLVHFIIHNNGVNHLWNKKIVAPADDLTHLYTMLLNPDQTYEVYIDGEQSAKGHLYDDWKIAAPRKIPDPEDKKPEDWVEVQQIEDPEDKKPEDWIEDLPEKIKDPQAKKPEEWDDKLDGAWEAPLIDNPNYRPKWKPRIIKNPAYKGPWLAKLIDNPEFKEIPNIYEFKDIGHVAVDVWQVKSGTIFDNILVTDDAKYAEKVAQETFAQLKEAEKKARDEFREAAKKAKAESDAANPESTIEEENVEEKVEEKQQQQQQEDKPAEKKQKIEKAEL